MPPRLTFQRVAALAALLHLFAASAAVHANDKIWQEVARGDLDFIYASIKLNHPGPIDADNPYFKQWMEQGYQEALARIAKVGTLQEAMNVQTYYIAGFADGHLGVNFQFQQTVLQWPGIIIERTGADYRVRHRQANWPTPLPAVGEQLLGCDGRDADTMLNEDVLRFRFNQPALQAARSRNARLLLRWDGIGEHPRAKSCRFSRDGVEHAVALAWRGIGNAAWLDYEEGEGVQAGGFALTEIAPQSYWVSLPTFYPDRAEEGELKRITAQLAQLQQAKLVVFDMRGNGGGNSRWGSELRSALYGQDYTRAHDAAFPHRSRAMWRASDGNVAAVAAMLPDIGRQFSPESAAYQQIAALLEKLRAASPSDTALVPQNAPVPRDDSRELAAKDTLARLTPRLAARVVLLSDDSCASACLDFADMLLPMPGVIHAGQPTWADTVYMDIRQITLPSALGTLSLAQKVYRDRPRAHNQPYSPAPQYLYPGDMRLTTPLQQWLLKRLPRD